MKILAVVVTYNGSRWIHRCLDSLVQSTLPLDIMVIDNQSTDDTIKIIESNFSQLMLVKSNENLGFGRANNIGLKKALNENYDYTFLLNQDAWIERSTMEILVSIQKQQQEFGIISPLHVNAKRDKLDSKFIEYICREPNKPFISDIVLHPDNLRNIYPISFINAAAWLISSTCLKVVGGFDPIFPHYGEDNDYIQRTQYHRFKVGICPKTFIVHDREGVTKQTDLKKSYAKNYVSSLNMLKNLEKPFVPTLLRWIGLQLRQIIKGILTFNLAYCWMKVKVCARVFYQLNKIVNSRAKSKNQAGTYL